LIRFGPDLKRIQLSIHEELTNTHILFRDIVEFEYQYFHMHEPDNFPKDPSSLRKYRQKIADVGKKLVTEYIRQEILSSGVDVNKESNGLIQKGRYSFRERKVKSINSDRTDEDHWILY